MAASFDRLEKNLDRLERFFSKRRKGTVIRDSLFGVNKTFNVASASAQHLQPTTPDPLFPRPSFITPTTIRMLARDEVNVIARSPRRAQSLPETPNSQRRLPSIDESKSISSLPATTKSATPRPKVPQRSYSLSKQQRDLSIAGLLQFSFTEKPRWTNNASISSLVTESLSPFDRLGQNHHQGLAGLQEALPIFSAHRPDTPPHSDSGDCASPSTSNFNSPNFSKALPNFPPVSNPTPEPSPKMRPVATHNTDSTFCTIPDNSISAGMKSQKHRSLEGPKTPNSSAVSLRKTVSDSTLSKAAPTPKSDDVLAEPTVNDFLTLSDDDIADGRPVTPSLRTPSLRTPSTPSEAPTFSLPPNPPLLQMPSPSSGRSKARTRGCPLISLSSPLTSKPAKAAAFECARIAQRFGFDLIYIANVWPVDLASCASSLSSPERAIGSPQSTRSKAAPSNLSPRSQTMTGRLLAAYNISSVQTPFSISPWVALKVLQRTGWLEYQSDRISPDEFAVGYSCAFYAGGGSDNINTPTASTTPAAAAENADAPTTVKSKGHNRGIIFAAYRLPTTDGARRRSDKSELHALHREAEALVEMLLDIHKTQRSRRRVAGKPVVVDGGAAEETGPLPVRPQFEDW